MRSAIVSFGGGIRLDCCSQILLATSSSTFASRDLHSKLFPRNLEMVLKTFMHPRPAGKVFPDVSRRGITRARRVHRMAMRSTPDTCLTLAKVLEFSFVRHSHNGLQSGIVICPGDPPLAGPGRLHP
jgi:hypothetical protein